MADIRELFPTIKNEKEDFEHFKGFDGGGGDGYDGDMEARVAKLEEFVTDARERLVKIETRLDGIGAQMATKADLHEGFNGMIKWVVGTAAILGGMAITIMTFVLNNAIPKQPSVPAAPIIVTVPNGGQIQAPTPSPPTAPTKK